MTAAEITAGLTRLGILHHTTLPYSPYQNAKQTAFWGPGEGRLIARLEDVPDLTLAFLNEATQAWVEYEYNRKLHSEIGEAPITRFLAGPDLWSEQAVGIIGGEPKCCKSFLALELAVAVASGTPCLRRFAVPRSGCVLLYAAEDALHIVRQRLEGISAAAGVALAALDIQVITAPSVRLDLEADRRSRAP